MGRYVEKEEGWLFCFQGITEKVTDEETLEKLSHVIDTVVEFTDLWKRQFEREEFVVEYIGFDKEDDGKFIVKLSKLNGWSYVNYQLDE